MVTIRMARAGAKKRSFYNVVVADQRRAPRGRFIERVGFYNPIASGAEEELRLDLERVDHWIARGARPSDSVSSLIDKARRRAAAA